MSDDGIGNQTELKLIISADGTVAIAGLKQVQDATRQHVDAEKSMLAESTAAWQEWALASAGAAAAVTAAWDMAEQGVKIQQTQEVFASATAAMGVNAQALLEKLDTMANGTVDDATLIQESMKLMVRGMSADQLPQIMEAARVAARTMGVDVSQAYGEIGDAIETMRSRTLLSFGLITPEQVKLMNALKNTGNEAEAFKLIMDNVAVQQASMPKVMENNDEKWQQMTADLRNIKDVACDAAASVWSFFSTWVKGMGDVEAIEAGTYDAYAKTAQASQGPQKSLDQAKADRDAEQKHAEALANAAANAKKAQTAADQLAKAELEWKDRIDTLNPALTDQEKKIDSLSAAATILRQTWAAKGQDTSWIDTELARGEQYIAQTNAQKEALAQYSAEAKTLADQQKVYYQQSKDAAAIDLKGTEDEIAARDRQIDLDTKWGQSTVAQQTEAHYQNQLALLQAQADEKQRLIAVENTYNIVSDAGDKERSKLAGEYEEIQGKINALVTLRGTVSKEEYVQELTYQNQLIDAETKHRSAIEQTYTTQLQEIQKLASASGVSASAGVGQMLSAAGNIAGLATGNDPYSKELAAAKKHFNDMLIAEQQGANNSQQVRDAANAVMLANDQIAYQQKMSLASNGFGMLAGLAQTFYDLSNQQSRAAFLAYKAFAVAQAIISGIASVQHSYAWGTTWGGPPGGALMAAIAAAASLANIAQIIAQQPPSTTASGTPASLGNTATTAPAIPTVSVPPSTAATTSTTTTPAASRPAPVININIYGSVVDHDRFARQVLPAIYKAMDDGV